MCCHHLSSLDLTSVADIKRKRETSLLTHRHDVTSSHFLSSFHHMLLWFKDHCSPVLSHNCPSTWVGGACSLRDIHWVTGMPSLSPSSSEELMTLWIFRPWCSTPDILFRVLIMITIPLSVKELHPLFVFSLLRCKPFHIYLHHAWGSIPEYGPVWLALPWVTCCIRKLPL